VEANDGGDAVLDDTGILPVQKNLFAAVIAELSQRDEGFL
jgi:hypothetical protein